MATPKDALVISFQRAEAAGWTGADPYDGLLSALGRVVIPLGSLPRIFAAQSVMRSKLVRGWARPSASVNPKGLALFLGAAVHGRRVLGEGRGRSLADALITELRERATERAGGACWGYPFPWQSRYFWAPAGTPNAVVTATAGWHLLEAADVFGDEGARSLATSAGKFLVEGLRWSDLGDDASAISYTPNDRSLVVNVSGLVARFLARLGDTDRAARLLKFIERSQNVAGGWSYSQEGRGGWEDSFHTGFLLESLLDLRSYGLPVSTSVLRSGFAAYTRFFDEDGGARLFPAATSAHDAHSAAQGMITYSAAATESDSGAFTASDPAAEAGKIGDWSMRQLWIPEQGRFAYRVSGGRRDETDYLRWVQGWMTLGTARVCSLQGLGSTRDVKVASA